MELDKIYNADCVEVLKNAIPNESIDLVLTDPPYKIGVRGSVGTMGGYWKGKLARQGKIFEHNEIECQDYIDLLYDALKDGGHCYIMCNNLNMPNFFKAISESKFKFIKLLTWDKGNKICGRYYMTQCEHIFLLRKGKEKAVNDCGMSDLLHVKQKRDKNEDGTNIHDSQKPVELFQLLIEQSSNEGDLVFDPFMGSGTTAIAAIRTKRYFIGCEIDEKYFELTNQRIKQEKQQLCLF